MKKGPLSARIYINEEQSFGVSKDKRQALVRPFLELEREIPSGHVIVHVENDQKQRVSFEIHRSDSISLENWFTTSRRWWYKKTS